MKNKIIILKAIFIVWIGLIVYITIKQVLDNANEKIMTTPSLNISTNINLSTSTNKTDDILSTNTNSNLNNNSSSTTKMDDILSTNTNSNLNNNSPSATKTDIIKERLVTAPLPAVEIKKPREVMAWIYPGAPTCKASSEYSTQKIDILKPEYFMISEEGELILLTVNSNGCNGYSAANVEHLKKYSKEQYVTISSSYAVSMDLFLTESLNNEKNINTLIAFLVDNNLTGLEIDFEDFGGWTSKTYSKYKQFVTKLGNSLHEKNKKLMIDGPATSNAVEEAWYVWRYDDFNNLPIDRLVIMAYDYQFDQGAGQPIAPIAWIQGIIKWTNGKFTNKTKMTIGVPSYGYKGKIGTNKFSLLTYEQIKQEPGFTTAVRDPKSFEMTWQNENTIYFYQDSESIARKIQTIQNSGINSISIWHLGGNLWF